MMLRYQINNIEPIPVSRKKLAKTIGELLKEDPKYLGAPTFSYQIGAFTLSSECVLSCDESTDAELIEQVLDALGKCEYEPIEWITLTVSMPRKTIPDEALVNLRKIVENKRTLLEHAFRTSPIEIKESGEEVQFPWFTVDCMDVVQYKAYEQFISMLCEFAKSRTRINNKPDTSTNEKFAFRCFLLRIGMIGDEYKKTRKILLQNLTGSSAFKNG